MIARKFAVTELLNVFFLPMTYRPQIEERFRFVVTGNLILGPCTRDVFVEASHILGIKEVT